MSITFDDLHLSPETLKAVKETGYTSPTPIQAKAIPAIQMTKDVVGLAQTGTGKTASFTLPMIDALAGGRSRARMPRSLVMAPTRELAAQVADNFDTYGKYHQLSRVLLVGGESMGEQIKLLEQGVDVLIATPGRLIDLFERGALMLNDIRILVIDEADRMLDMGFIPDIERIVSLTPSTRQTLLFSATMPNEIRKLTEKFLTNPKEVSVSAPATTAETVEQFVVNTSPKGKNNALLQLFEIEDIQNAFIFLNRKKDVDQLSRFLKKHNIPAAGMHGDMVQSYRTETLEAFKNNEITFLVCSDIAARGLDVKGVSHVFNYDVPFNADDYVHRIGRTGRAGKSGRAWMLVTKDDEKSFAAIQKLIKKDIEVVDLAQEKAAEKAPEEGTAEKATNKTPQKKQPAKKYNKQDDIANDAIGFGEEEDIPDFMKQIIV